MKEVGNQEVESIAEKRGGKISYSSQTAFEIRRGRKKKISKHFDVCIEGTLGKEKVFICAKRTHFMTLIFAESMYAAGNFVTLEKRRK